MRDPRLYDAAAASRGRSWDIDLYVELASQARPPVLEIGGGTGRILIPLLRAGIDAYAIDTDLAMVEAGREKLRALVGPSAEDRLQVGDARHALPARSYGAVIAPYNVLSAILTEADLRAALGQMAAVAVPGAMLAFDVIVAEALDWSRPPYTWSSPGRPLPELAAVLEEQGSFDPTTRLHRITQTFRTGGAVVREELVLRPWREQELVDALAATGWDWQAPAWNQQRAPLAPSDTILVGRATRRSGGG
jgi:Methyltransferase domain